MSAQPTRVAGCGDPQAIRNEESDIHNDFLRTASDSTGSIQAQVDSYLLCTCVGCGASDCGSQVSLVLRRLPLCSRCVSPLTPALRQLTLSMERLAAEHAVPPVQPFVTEAGFVTTQLVRCRGLHLTVIARPPLVRCTPPRVVP